MALTMLLPAGSTSDRPAKAGCATLTADMLDEGAGPRNALEFADALDMLGASFRADSQHETTTISLSSLVRNFEAALDLYSDAVLRPRFDRKEWQRVQSLHVQGLRRALDNPSTVARWVGMRAFFGDGHPYSRPTGGTPESAAAVTIDEVRAFHGALYRPSQASFLVAGDMTGESVKGHLERAFGGWRDSDPTGVVVSPVYPPPANRALRVVMVDRPGAVQTVINFVMPGLNYGEPNRPKLQLLGTILGGSFTSRLNRNLREEHGYTYGARCRYAMNPQVGFFTAGSAVRADVTGEAIGEFLKEFTGLRSGDVRAEEARKARSTRRMQVLQAFGSLRGIVNNAATLVRNGRPFTELTEELDTITSVSETDLNHLAREAIPLERGLLVLVGDKARIVKGVEDLGLPTPEELTAGGSPVARGSRER
jgi:predicted Zn-dependent peptidase